MKLDVEMRMFINHTHLKIISKNKKFQQKCFYNLYSFFLFSFLLFFIFKNVFLVFCLFCFVLFLYSYL